MKLEDYLQLLQTKIRTIFPNFTIYDINLPKKDNIYGEYEVLNVKSQNNWLEVNSGFRFYIKHKMSEKYLNLYKIAVKILKIITLTGGKDVSFEIHNLNEEIKNDYVIFFNFIILCNEDLNEIWE